jgi:hypothetical protein
MEKGLLKKYICKGKGLSNSEKSSETDWYYILKDSF